MDALSATFSALADPTRRSMLARLAGGEAAVNALAVPFDMSVQAISRHLKVLEAAGLISRSRDAQFRPSRFEAAPLESALAWIEQTRHGWEGLSEQAERARRGAGEVRHTSTGGEANDRVPGYILPG